LQEYVDMDSRLAARSHPRSRFLGLTAFAIILMLATVAIPLLTSASTYRGGFTVNTSSATVQGNLYVGSFRSRIDSNVTGDLTLASFSSSVYGNVGGSLHLLGGRTSIHSDVDGSVYMASGNVDVHGTISGDLVIGAGRANLADGSRVQGDVIVLAGQLRSGGDIDGSLYGSTLLMDQQGNVGGNMEIQSDRLSIAREASVDGDLHYQSPTDADISIGATITGETERTNATPWTGIGAGALAPFGPLLKLVWALLAGAALIALAPRLMYRFAELAAPVVQPAIVGAIGLVSIPVFATIAMITILGIPIGILMFLALGIGLYLSQVIVGLTIGRFLLPRRWRDGSRGYLLLAATIGLILIGVLRILPIPFLNMAVVTVVSFLGLGAFISIVLDLTSDKLRTHRTRFA
jgi:cytoskeletal protein CcmA (bactofilin family)